MAFSRLTPVVGDIVDDILARIQGSGDLAKCKFLRGTLRSFEQDDRTSPVNDLWQLQLAQSRSGSFERPGFGNRVRHLQEARGPTQAPQSTRGLSTAFFVPLRVRLGRLAPP